MGIDIGTTDQLGEWRPRRKFSRGQHELKVNVKGFGPEPPTGTPAREWEYSKICELDKDQNTEQVVLTQVLPRVHAKVQLATSSQVLIPKATVSVDNIAMGITDKAGECVTDAFELGAHTITASKPGYQVISITPSITSFTQPIDYSVVVRMTDKWGLIDCEKVKVGGLDFPKWFNTVFRKKHRGKVGGVTVDGGEDGIKAIHAVIESNFNTIFNDCAQWGPAEMTVREFVSLFFYIYNETGGQFAPIVEPYPDKKPVSERLKYLFEAKGKKSYNGLAGNQLAGEQLVKMTNPNTKQLYVLTPAQRAAWNATSADLPPNDPTPIHESAQECDFHKFRGRGLGQLTGRANYNTYAQPVFTSGGLGSIDAMSDAELTDNFHKKGAAIYYAIMKNFLSASSRKSALAQSDGDDFGAFGLAVSGGTAYSRLFQSRSTKLLEEMDKDGVQITRRGGVSS